MTKRICCFIDSTTDTPCGAEAEWEMLGSNAVYEFVDSRTGWWRFHEHYDRDGYCDNPARGY